MYEILFLLLSSLLSLLRMIISGGCGFPITSHALPALSGRHCADHTLSSTFCFYESIVRHSNTHLGDLEQLVEAGFCNNMQNTTSLLMWFYLEITLTQEKELLVSESFQFY